MFKKKPLVHENPHIEVINHNLWAVRFSLIPMIPQLSITHKEGTEAAPNINDLELTFSPDGIMILNKDHKYYKMFRQAAISAMMMNPRQINKELADLSRQKVYKPMPVIYRYVLMAELERQRIKKGGGA